MVSKLGEIIKAIWKDDFKTIELELKSGVEVNQAYNEYGWTPFMLACKEYPNPSMIELFIQYGADVNYKNKDGMTPLHIMARKRSSFDCLRVLVDKGADVNALDKDGNTPLMCALSHPQISMRMGVVEFLLLSGTDITITNKYNETAYDIASKNNAFVDKVFLRKLDMNYKGLTKSEQIAKLNDNLRANPSQGVVVLTQGIRANSPDDIQEILKLVKEYNDFDEDNDPYGEHDFGAITFKNNKIFWKIDYYDKDFVYLSPNASKAKLTNRVLTIMYADEY